MSKSDSDPILWVMQARLGADLSEGHLDSAPSPFDGLDFKSWSQAQRDLFRRFLEDDGDEGEAEDGDLAIAPTAAQKPRRRVPLCEEMDAVLSARWRATPRKRGEPALKPERHMSRPRQERVERFLEEFARLDRELPK